MALPPGFRFHPTDVELITYYLKRKVMGKKLCLEAIAEVNIYNFSPWDLPDKSCFASKDLEWFFFCPREMKYASGTRVKRATENGYWKPTGNQRSISYDDKIAGTVKTLVFHLGHPPKGERTDWLIHEYKILDDALAAAGVQDTYVLYKVFKKKGLSPKNGAQSGAPFNEADWADDDVNDALDVTGNISGILVGSSCLARMALPPGFRFHPTDVELIMYYLKRKVMGKKLCLEAIADVNIYNFLPWDLPDKSCFASKDLEWFFFCPREKKYASGTRVKRATENGYWKPTGNQRSISYDDKIAGTVKTLVFHLGHPPKGERTDWLIHEYKILDDALAAAGVQDTYVLCKVFKKNGLSPKNGAQYGAPFNEADWADDDVNDALDVAISVAPTGPPLSALLPEKQSSLMGGSFVPETTQAMSLTEKGPDTNRSFNAMALFDPGTISGQSPIEGGPNGQCSFVPSGLFDTGNTSGPAASRERKTASAMPSKSEVVVDESDDEMVPLLSAFTEDNMLLLNQIVDIDNPKRKLPPSKGRRQSRHNHVSSSNKRAEPLEYSGHLRASAKPAAASASPTVLSLQPTTAQNKWEVLMPSFLRTMMTTKDKGKKKDTTTTKIKVLVKSLQVRKTVTFITKLFRKLRTHR